MTDEELASKINALEPVVAQMQQALTQDDDPWGFAEAQELLRLQRVQSRRKLNAMHPGNRFRLMLGQPLLPETNDKLCNRGSAEDEQ